MSNIDAEADMVEELKRHLLHKPFAPFQIVLKSGERLEVVRQFQVGIGLTQFGYVAPDGKRFRHFLKLDDIVALNPSDQAAAS